MCEVEITLSKLQPGITGASNCFSRGDSAIYTANWDGSEYIVEIDSILMSHADAALDGLVYECILDEALSERFGLSRCCLSAHQLTPNLTAEDCRISPEMEASIQRRISNTRWSVSI